MATLRKNKRSPVKEDILSSDLGPREAGCDYQSILLIPNFSECYFSLSAAQDRNDQSFRDLMSHLMCILLHVLLVLLHGGLFAVWWYHLEHRVVISLTKSSVMSSAHQQNDTLLEMVAPAFLVTLGI